MTIPRGFGKGWDRPDTEKTTKCGCTFIQKSIIGREYGVGNGYHSGYSCHDARKTIMTVMIITVSFIALLMLVSVAVDISAEANRPLMNNIEGYNCNQLAEYIADKSKRYSYAEHRYEWLCVNEQIKEFT